MRELLKMLGKKKSARRQAVSSVEWMRGQLKTMNKMNQGVILMGMGR